MYGQREGPKDLIELDRMVMISDLTVLPVKCQQPGNREAMGTIFTVFGMIWPGIKPTTTPV